MDCRFLDAPDQVGRVRWFEAAPDAETLPFESVILRTDWEIDPWMDAPVGEVSGAARSTDLTRAPRGSGRGHVCGTEEQFREGAHYDPDAPPVLYGGSGLPHCCGLWPVLRGGAGAGGHAALVVMGGIVGGTCDEPALCELGVTYSSHWSGVPAFLLLRYWFPNSMTALTSYRIIVTSTDPTGDYSLATGTEPCDVDGFLAVGDFATACRSGFNDTVATGAGATLTVATGVSGDPYDFTFRVEVGEC